MNTPWPGSSRSWSEVVFTPQQGERSTPTMPSTVKPCFRYSRICRTT